MGPRKMLWVTVAWAGMVLPARDVAGEAESYGSGFYTRGSDAAASMDQGDALLDPFYVPVRHWALLPRATMTATRDDNIFLDSQNPESATTIDLIPGILAMYGRPEGNNLYADLGMIIPLYDSSDLLEEREGYLLTAGGVHETGVTRVDGRLGYRRTENTDTLVGARIVEEDYLAAAGVERRRSRESSVGLNGGLEFHDYEDPSYVDYRRQYGAGRLYHRVTSLSDSFLQLGMGRDDLDSEPGNYGDADFFDMSLGLRGKQTAKTSVSGRVGYQWRQYDDASIADVDHWIAAIGASSRPTGLTTISGDVTADVRPAINAAGSSTADQRATLGVQRRLFSERLRGHASLFYGFVEYHGPNRRAAEMIGESDLVYDGREDEYDGFSLGLDGWTQHNLSVGLTYSYLENLGARGGPAEEQERTSYESGRWILRVSWNY
jgi:hypothetical protein